MSVVHDDRWPVTAAPVAGAGRSPEVLVCEGLTKDYGKSPVLQDVSFSVRAGERVALLGPNGAGKSTLVDLLLGLTRPTSGTIRHGGPVPGQNPGRRRGGRAPIRAMLQEAGHIDHLTGADLLAYEVSRSGEAGGLGIEEVVEALGVSAVMRRPVKRLSGGEKRKLDLVLALAVPADLLVLDEPTTGMDLEGRAATIDLVRRWCEARGQSLLLTTHLLEEAEALADRVLVLAEHRLRLDRSMADLAAGHRSVYLDTRDDRVLEVLRSRASDVVVGEDGVRARLPGDHLDGLLDLLQECRREGLAVPGLRIAPVSLAETYQEVVSS